MIADRVVIDTSILISAALSPAGKPARVVRTVSQTGRLVFTARTFEEFSSRIRRPKFDRYFRADGRELFLNAVISAATWVEITGKLKACRDPEDDKFLETAVVAVADCIVTGDGDLLVLDQFQQIPILTAARFLELV